jgi:outer membrane lipoprotein carrier protein
MDFVKYSPRLHRATSRIASVFLLVILAAGVAWSQEESDKLADSDATELLDHYIADVRSFAAGFEQTLFDVDGLLIESETSVGRFSLLRPDRFLWHYDTPFEQIIVADGESIWMYDVELESVTRAPLSDLATSPAMLLSGEGTVGDRYHVASAPSTDGRRWVELLPVDERDSDFISAKIAFRDGVPSALQLRDGLGQLTRIEFTEVEVNAGLAASDFEFVPPAGVQVVGGDD